MIIAIILKAQFDAVRAWIAARPDLDAIRLNLQSQTGRAITPDAAWRFKHDARRHADALTLR